MAQDNYKALREFEEKIIDITCDNLEIITGQQIQITIDHIEPYSESVLELLAPINIHGTVEFSNDGYTPWGMFLPAELGEFLASTMLGEEPSGEFNADDHLEPVQELLAQVMSPYLSELSSIEGEQVDASEIHVVQSEETPKIFEDSLLVSYQVTVGQDQQFQMYKAVPDAILEVLENDVSTKNREEIESESLDESSQPEMSDAQFQQFSSSPTNGNGANLDMLMDLEMPITIELGRTKLTIKNILQLGQGSIIELDKLSGDPVDVYINDRKFAEGEVVVVDENFGVRITEIVSPVEKIKSLQ